MLELLVTIATGDYGSPEVLDAIEDAIDGSVDLHLVDAAIEALRETNLMEVYEFPHHVDSEQFDRWLGDRTYRHVHWHGSRPCLDTRDLWENDNA